MQEELFDHQAVAERVVAETLIVDVDGFEGPLDLLLALSRIWRFNSSGCKRCAMRLRS